MLLTTPLQLCLAFGTSHMLAAVRGAPNPSQPQTVDPDQGRAVPKETAIHMEETTIVVETVVVSAPPESSSISTALPSATLVPASPPESSAPASSSIVSPLPKPSTKKPDTTFCGTSGSANLDDCKQLLNDKDGFAAMSVLRLNPVLCELTYGQTCCIFHHWRDNDKYDNPDIEQVRLEALELLGCVDQEKGKISALGRFGGHGVCIASEGGGPGKCPIFHMGELGIDDQDCFDDQDWTYGIVPPGSE